MVWRLIHRDGAALDVNLLHVGADVERIAVGDDDIRHLAVVEGAEFVGEPKISAPD